MHFLLLGIILGLGVAIPIGPVNLEVIRRNLRFGTSFGMVTGLGACAADITYLILLCFGTLALLQYPMILRSFGIVGSLILAWFAINAFRAQSMETIQKRSRPSLLRYGIEGYAMTMINPFTILFWASVSSQISLHALSGMNGLLLAGLGVIIGTVGWVISLNILIHFTRHKLTPRAIQWLNYTGGTILMGFALMGILRALSF